MNDQEYRAKIGGWVIALALGIVFFVLATITSGRGEPQAPLLAGSTVKVLLDEGHGSAVHLGKGRFLTARHVVVNEDGEITKGLRVLNDKGTTAPATVLWVNKDYDIALVQSDMGSVRSSPLECRETRVGEDVHASGNPLDHEFITTYGRVAGKAHAVDDGWRSVVAVDITVGPGMSGGPVFDKAENIIGITAAMTPWRQGARLFRTLMLMVPSTVACDLLVRS
jgi:S1-C subfamily serine protease